MKKKRLSYHQFQVLTQLEVGDSFRRQLMETLGMDADLMDEVLHYLESEKLISSRVLLEGSINITRKGLRYLEPYRVRKAIILAAGLGERLIPVTVNTPKPLVSVKGTPIIVTQIDALYRAGVEEITVVTGHLADQFELLKKRYPKINLVRNPEYSSTNNISSVFYVRNLLENTYVLEGDIYVNNPSMITKYQWCSNYLGFYVDGDSEDWCFTTLSDGRTIDSQQLGGQNCYQEVGISYWTEEDGRQLGQYLEETYLGSDNGKTLYWDNVAFCRYKGFFASMVRPCQKEDFIEIDTFNDLVTLDSSYSRKR